MARYSDIRRAAQLNQALQNYINYLGTPRTPNVGGGTPRGPQQQLFIQPFGQDLPLNSRVQVQASTDSYAALSQYIVAGNGAEADTAIGANSVVNLPKFRPARVVWFRNPTRTVQTATSGVTGQRYLKYNGDRDSCPFGRAAADDDQMDVFNAIKADILTTNTNLEVNRVSITREKIGA
ncbi:MAG: hypothetical protein AAF766_22795 [Cyanobacteria bacterium P01_D01_bin.14]